MEPSTITATDKTRKKEVSKKEIFLKKIDSESFKLLQQLKDRVNKKTIGRKIKDGEVIGLALKLISSDQIKELQEMTYSEKDRLALAHDDYQKRNGKLTIEQFISKLLNGEISTKNN